VTAAALTGRISAERSAPVLPPGGVGVGEAERVRVRQDAKPRRPGLRTVRDREQEVVGLQAAGFHMHLDLADNLGAEPEL